MTEEEIEIILEKLAEVRKMIIETQPPNRYVDKNFKAVYRIDGNDYPITGKVFKYEINNDFYLLAMRDSCNKKFWPLSEFDSSKAVKEGYEYGWCVTKGHFSLDDIYEFEII